jgi:ornithine cyclodeaminase/alanine dehydrogenase-like protein (mu-crystallin family)
MVLILSELDVQRLLDYEEALDAIEKATRMQAEGLAHVNPRSRVYSRSSVLHVMSSTIEPLGVSGVKAYLSTPSRTVFVILLYSIEGSRLLAIIEGDVLSRIRTGAASALATKYLARRGASTLGIIGSGRQAYTQALAIASVMKPERIHIYSLNREHAESMAKKLLEKGLKAEVSQGYRDVISSSDVIATATNSREPFVRAEWVGEGTHINLVGSNHPSRSEAHPELFQRANLVVTDNKEQAQRESGDIINAVSSGYISWDRVFELWEILSGRVGRVSEKDITIFKSHGIALWDVAVAKLVYDKARERGLGREVGFNGYWENRFF